MKPISMTFALALLAATVAQADPAKRDTLPGVNGFAFGATFDTVKKSLGAAAKAATDPDNPKNKILLAKATLFGEKFAVNYTFNAAGHFSHAYTIAIHPTGDYSVCQTHWVGIRSGLADEWGNPDVNIDKLANSSIPSQTLTYNFDNGATIEAGLLGCLLTVNYFSPTAPK